MLLCWPVGTCAALQSIDQIFLLLKSLHLGALRTPRKEKNSRIYQVWESTKVSLMQNSQNNQRSEAPKSMRRAGHHIKPETYCMVWVSYCICSFQLLGIPSDPTQLCHLLPGFPYHCHFTVPGKHRSPLAQTGNGFWQNCSSPAETCYMGSRSPVLSHPNLKGS